MGDYYTIDDAMISLREGVRTELDEMCDSMCTWAGYTYGYALQVMAQNPEYGRAELQAVADFIYDERRRNGYDRLLIADRPMNGYSMTKMGPKNELRTDVMFDKVYQEMNRTGFTKVLVGSPIHYMYTFVWKYLSIHPDADTDTLNGNIARSFQYYPSALREKSLSLMLRYYLPGGEVSSTEAGDRFHKTDICVDITDGNGNLRRFRIWSYQSTQNGIDNTYLKFSGKRNSIPPEPGFHILAPFESGRNASELWGFMPFTDVFGWYLYSWPYAEYLIRMMMGGTPVRYDDFMRMGEARVKNCLRFPQFVFVEKPSGIHENRTGFCLP